MTSAAPPQTFPAFAALGVAWRAATAAVEALPARAAYDAAGQLQELAGELVEWAADLRARMAARIAREAPGGMTVRQLAAELGVAPSNAGDLLARAARLARAPREETPGD
jgi:predicted transcriptional regulator